MTRDDPSAFAPPPAFGPFRVLHQIGVGALGPVFRTYEPTRDRLVAVKVFRLDITPEQAQALADELSKAADAGLFHPSIVEPIAAGVEGTVAYRAEEYVAGESMDAAIRHYAPAALDKALPFLTQLAGAIDFARAAGVGHGALHLRDIFVTPDEARASGFGVVDALERVGLRAPVRRPYSAPERIAGGPWGTPADVFSLAAIAYELLTGRRPAGTGEQIGVLTGDAVGEHAAAIRTVLARAMDDDPARRYQSALGFASALEAAARGGHVTEAVRDVGAIAAAVPAGTSEEEDLTGPSDSLRVAPVAPRLDEPADATIDAAVVEDHDAADVDDIPAGEVIFDDEAPDEYAAHHDDLPIDEPPPARTPPATLFDTEPAGMVEAETPATERFAPEFPATSDHDAEAPPPHERARMAMLPIAVTAILCLLVGFGLGRMVDSGAAKPAEPAAAAAAAPVPAAPAQPVKEFSDQAVTPPAPPGATGGKSPTPAPAPPVPGDEPSATPPAAARAPAPKRATSGSLEVRSTPSRAQVTIDGKWRGRTPLTLPMAFGSHSVRVVQPGYATATESVTLSANDPERQLSFRLQAAPAAAPPRPRAQAPAPPPSERTSSFTGAIYVDSRPRGATIFIDGKAAGTTPARIPEIAIGSHVVRLELADHRTWSTSTRVTAGEEARVTGSLELIR